MSEWTVKRFWTKAEPAPTDDGYAVHLDGRPVRTPAKVPLTLPNHAAAQAVADEWDAQEEVLSPANMPATRWANAAIDKVAHQQDEVAEMLVSYGETDLLCYRAAQPKELVARQAEAWDPWLDWAGERFGARLIAAEGVMPQAQKPGAVDTLGAPVRDMTAFELAAFHDLVSLTGSLVLGLAAADGAAEPDRLWTLSRLDELWQAEQWGVDAEAEEAAAKKQHAFVAAARHFALVRETFHAAQ
ncbi:Chaperone required for the assembly of the F1-ATPase [Tranquillimonas rosea]|uniref:Chaperone required for the assembly of the F1-ATPase n=1 Tax=Tranquillimonas rosea TaxID=641238 RepID=A0A1H9X6W3_9RHOB|nr:ATP12 family protein [Tranquillimonas rosea]SES41801.1 Chaperone required for the assembly of the F1-ATPase [Tranquillimonas rosea]